MLPGAFVCIREGRGNLSKERFPFPSPNPTPLLPKAFTFIESLFVTFPKSRTGTGANKKVS